MPEQKSAAKEQYYFPEKLRAQLGRISDYPLTLVEAPSGFGKTTAVSEYLHENLPRAAYEYWYTCLGESPAKAWSGICGLFERIDGEFARNLRKLEQPTVDTLPDILLLFREFRCPAETYLVIDNYQLTGSGIPREMVSAFSMHGNEKLHIIIITQQLPAKEAAAFHNANIHRIDMDSLSFDKESTAKYFRMASIRLNDNELEVVYNSAAGWVSFIRLQMMNYKDTGTFERSADIDCLLETAIWNRLAADEQEFLMSLSILDSVTVQQAKIMLDEKTIPNHLNELLGDKFFIKYFPEKNIYVMHSILQIYLRNRFYNNRPEDFQKRVLKRAGDACTAVSDYFPAAGGGAAGAGPGVCEPGA